MKLKDVYRTMFAGALGAALLGGAGQLDAATVTVVEDFESYNAGDVPTSIVASFGHGSATIGEDGGNRFAILQPGPDDSRSAGQRQGPHGSLGRQVPFLGIGDTYSIFVDIFAASAPGASGSLTWVNMVNNSTDGSYLDENSFVFTPGENTWNATFTSGGSPSSHALSADSWYTVAMTWDRSAGTNYDVTASIFAQGDLFGSAIFTSTMTQNTLSSELGGPIWSWFTKWDNNTVDELRIDNYGIAYVPTPAAGGMAVLGLATLALRRRR